MVIKHGKYAIVLRPIAIILVVAIVGVVAWRFLSAGGSALHESVAAQNRTANPIDNPDFEEGFLSATTDQESRMSDRKAEITGSIAAGWKDRSRWSEVKVDYEPQNSDIHNGKHAQKIEIREIKSGAVKFCQGVRTLPGQRYRLTLWVRASHPMPIVVGIRKMQDSDYDIQKDCTAGLEWQKFEIEGAASGQFSYIMLEANQAGTLFVDDASFTEL